MSFHRVHPAETSLLVRPSGVLNGFTPKIVPIFVFVIIEDRILHFERSLATLRRPLFRDFFVDGLSLSSSHLPEFLLSLNTISLFFKLQLQFLHSLLQLLFLVHETPNLLRMFLSLLLIVSGSGLVLLHLFLQALELDHHWVGHHINIFVLSGGTETSLVHFLIEDELVKVLVVLLNLLHLLSVSPSTLCAPRNQQYHHQADDDADNHNDLDEINQLRFARAGRCLLGNVRECKNILTAVFVLAGIKEGVSPTNEPGLGGIGNRLVVSFGYVLGNAHPRCGRWIDDR
mmetsp:Transcript_1957/g.3800  ORF Transcript_1957/g.3800 Transcript_1957/m.3800 type:complete len:287 (-) Transcript_1957:10852-11712(-)